MRKRGKIGFSLLLSLLFIFLSRPTTLPGNDLDRDGLDEALEESLARRFIPWIWYWSHESCPEPGVILYHVRPYAPGGSPDTLAITYSAIYYEDCGINGHDFDIESFSVTLYPIDNSPSGFGVHSLTTYAHLDSGCETSETRVYAPPELDLGDPADTIHTSWEEIWVSDDKHGFFLSEGDCDPGCWFSDECESELVMNDGRLVAPENGQFFHLYNVGEMNDPLIVNLTEINEDGGFTFDPVSIWGTAPMVERHYLTSPGPYYPVALTISTFPYPNPLRKCEDQSIGIDLGYRGLVLAEIFKGNGQSVSQSYIGEICPGDDIRFQTWDGRDDLGDCLANGPMIARITAIRGCNADETSVSFSIQGDSYPKPSTPANLAASFEDDHVRVTWSDTAVNEMWFTMERRAGACGFSYLTNVGAHSGTGTVIYEDHDVYPGETFAYRVFATGEGGFSAPSNTVSITTPACLEDSGVILGGPTLSSDAIYDSRTYTVSVDVVDPDCPFLHYEWTVYGNQQTDPGTIYGTGSSIIYQAPNIDCTELNAPACQNKIDVTVGFQGNTSSATTGWFSILCPSPGDGCPFLYVWNGDRFVPENNLMPLSEIGSEDLTDFYPLATVPVLRDGRYSLEIREDGDEHSFIDALELLCIDHLPRGHIGVTAEGRIFGYDAIDPPVWAEPPGGQVPPSDLERVDGVGFTGETGDQVHVRFSPPGSGLFALFSLPEPELKSFGPAIRLIPNDAGEVLGGGIGIGMGVPRHRGGPQFFDGSLHDPSNWTELELTWLEPVGLDCLGEVSGLTFDVHPRRLALQEAFHVSDGDVLERLLREDRLVLDLRKGERIRLGFEAPDPADGLVRDFILKIRGHYVR